MRAYECECVFFGVVPLIYARAISLGPLLGDSGTYSNPEIAHIFLVIFAFPDTAVYDFPTPPLTCIELFNRNIFACFAESTRIGEDPDTLATLELDLDLFLASGHGGCMRLRTVFRLSKLWKWQTG